MKRYLLIGATLIGLAGCSSNTGPAAAPPSTTAITSTTARTTSATSSAVEPTKTEVVLICDIPGKRIEVSDPTDFPAAWALKPTKCAANRSTTPLSPLEQQAVTAAGYTTPSGIETLYRMCVENGTAETYLEAGFVPSGSQIKEITGMLVLCPSHPQAAAYKSAAQRGQADADAEAAGELFGNGTYRVGEEVKPGTYAIEGDIADCYWERTDRNGNIIANNFVGGAKRVQVTIRSGDYSFTSRSCGQWRKAG